MCTHECKNIAKCTHDIFKTALFGALLLEEDIVKGGELYGGQGCVVLADRGWLKPKSSGLNQEPTKKKASRLGTWFWDFSSSWYPVRYPFADFLVRPGTSGLKFLVQPGSSWINQEVLGSTRKILPFPRPFSFFIGKFFGNGSIFHYKKWTMV